ncbi:SU10 major capsid protein [Bacillus massiliigorillae]|uniref:SU10 major capsid protein n=1 Tax=Bacillus massiliigorillae TaxID=1243664 RepID=UPI0003A27167|nr:DUF5309 family protein [Bacillus massiliigorillae]
MTQFSSQDFVTGQNYDVKDVLIEVNKKQTPFTTFLLSKTSKATAPQVHWITEEIADSAVSLAEGGDAPAFTKDTLKPLDNYLELFANTATVTNTAQYSTAKGISDLLAHEVEKKAQAIKRRMENKFIHGTKGYTAGTYTTAGVLAQIDATNKVTGTIADNLESVVEKLYDAGVSDNMLCFIPAKLKQELNKSETVTFLAREKFLGFDVEEYITAYGVVRFALCEALGNDTLFIINPDYVEMAELIPFHAEVQSANGSKQSVFLETQAGVQLLNPLAGAMLTVE